jgi:two-component system response regulator
VEDNEVDVEITERIFARSGVSVSLRVARDGKEALDLLLSGRGGQTRPAPEELPALILLDLRLPTIDGIDVLRRLKADPELCAIPVAVLTGAAGERPMLESMALGGNMYFVKPISAIEASTLIPAVRKYWDVMERLRVTTRNHEG